MINLGVIENYISPRYINRYHIEIYNKDKLYKLALANKSPTG
jgi:hypothetical protein